MSNPECQTAITIDNPNYQRVFDKFANIRSKLVVTLGHHQHNHPLSKFPSDVLLMTFDMMNNQREYQDVDEAVVTRLTAEIDGRLANGILPKTAASPSSATQVSGAAKTSEKSA
ncbi:MAG: hypothetical protein V4612_04315 [Pseudomonadota bacterium]